MVEADTLSYSEFIRDLGPGGLRPITRDELRGMVVAGVIGPREPVELLRGVLVAMTPTGNAHLESVTRINEALTPALLGRARVVVQAPFAASETSQPEPDLAVYPARDYSKETPSEALLLIEVSKTSLSKDRKVKAPLYAECGVREYWIVDLVARTVEVRTEPVDGQYRRLETLRSGDTLRPTAFPDLAIPVDAILPTP